MKNNKAGTFVLIGVAIVLLLGFFVYLNWSNLKHNWQETFRPDSKEPYGTSVIAGELQNYFGKDKFTLGKQPLAAVLSGSTACSFKNVVFIGNMFYLGEPETDSLLAFVASGRNAFIASGTIPSELLVRIKLGGSGVGYNFVSSIEDSSCSGNFYHTALKAQTPYRFQYLFEGQIASYSWSYFRHLPDSASAQEIGFLTLNNTDYIRIPWGRGYFYFHLNPLFFANYQLLNERNLEYCEKVFSHLPRENTYWAEFNRLPSGSGKGKHNQEESPLKYILSQVALRWAWYSLLVLVLLYFLFRAKRRQRMIPIVLPNENLSLEFVQTIGALYYRQNDHQKLCVQKMRLFLMFIRERYFLKTNVVDEKLIKKIAEKSGRPLDEVKHIFSLYQLLLNTVIAVTESDLISFHKALDNFYRSCK